ncbi:hypothetical protein PS645_00970 [Pseudomonas fluorescens]|uniref:Uncharacterized protein n=1 Tax=Pseudomonas fluorescens TaxID=294 RepID=A0A5E6QIU8_PSEFL|nr:hypothetical protein PS645_00970 [Pseudomonas fluorescens]
MPHREQARSHMEFAFPCGSGHGRERAIRYTADFTIESCGFITHKP